VLALGLVVYVAAWAFGSKPLYPVASGLLLVSLVAWGWVHLSNGAFVVQRPATGGDHVEGDDVPIAVTVEPSTMVRPPVAELVERIGRLGEHRHQLRPKGRRLAITYTLANVPRGRYAFEDNRLELSDPFGLQRVTVPLQAPGALLVYPRIVHLDRLFSESGAHGLDGRRLLLRRPTGYDLHSVREYEHGESLRKVHWRSTAHRGRLMVKELEDSPRDEIALVLDADAGAVVAGSFDTQVRAAASIVDAYAARGRRTVLVINGARREEQQLHAAADGRRRALELLAGAEPDGRTPLATLLADEGGAAARALELLVVTARLEPAAVDRLTQRALGHRKVALVYVDAPSFAGAAPHPLPSLLRLQAAGVALAVVHAGDDLATALEGSAAVAGVAHA
jgi:uncharacterized protein (DUF58 family)